MLIIRLTCTTISSRSILVNRGHRLETLNSNTVDLKFLFNSKLISNLHPIILCLFEFKLNSKQKFADE